jgi:hypothetical protein
MTIKIKTDNPTQLLKAIKNAIDNDEVRTWSYDEDGDLTHTKTQWVNKAFLRPQPKPGELHLTIMAPDKVKITPAVYGVYHGRFIEMLLSHFSDMFSTATAYVPKNIG